MQKHTNVSQSISYIQALYAQEDALLCSIRERLIEEGIAIHIGAEEGKLLQLFVKMAQVKTIVEIGTLGGYSTLWMARALPEDGKIITIEASAKHANWAREYFAASDVGHKIELIEGKAQDVLSVLVDRGQVDMLFIDADKAGYPAYLAWADSNVKPNGLIIADNTLMFSDICMYRDHGGHKGWEALRVFNGRLADVEKYDAVIVPTEAGLSVAIKR